MLQRMQQMPKRDKPTGIKIKCVVCGDKFDFVSASFVPICNRCRKHHRKKKDCGLKAFKQGVPVLLCTPEDSTEEILEKIKQKD